MMSVSESAAKRRGISDPLRRAYHGAMSIGRSHTASGVDCFSGRRNTVDAESISVSGGARDFGAGVHRATCNGRPAMLQGSFVTCSIGLHDGVNDIIIQAMDVAGNSGSTGVRVVRAAPPRSIAIIPGTATLVGREPRSVQLVDGVGRPLTGAVWWVSNPFIATVESNGVQTNVRGLGPGEVVLHASWGSLSASAQFTRSLSGARDLVDETYKPAPARSDIVMLPPSLDGPCHSRDRCASSALTLPRQNPSVV